MKSDEAVVLFMDILGFAALTEQHPDIFVTRQDERFTSTSMTPSSQRFNAFHGILERYDVLKAINGADRLMIFSDCAFLVFPNAVVAALHAVELQREFILKRVPVRMGLGLGTCHAVRFTSDSHDGVSLTRAMFSGTAVVRAHKAEANGEAGCRIFVHPSLANEVQSIENVTVPVLPLACPSRISLSGRHWELDQVPAVGDPTHMVQLGTSHRVSAGEGQRRVALQ